MDDNGNNVVGEGRIAVAAFSKAVHNLVDKNVKPVVSELPEADNLARFESGMASTPLVTSAIGTETGDLITLGIVSGGWDSWD